MTHPLDRPAWSALNSGWRRLALGDGRALQLDPAYGPFAAMAGDTPENRAALADFKVGMDGLWLQELTPLCTPPPGLVIERSAAVAQMVTDTVMPGEAGFKIAPLEELDAPAMRALAALAKPGPFAKHTHRLSPFVGVKHEGRLVAMAGERMQLDDYAEVSGVLHPPPTTAGGAMQRG